MPTIFQTMRLILESSDEKIITPESYPFLFKKILKLKKASINGKMSIQGDELVDLYRYFRVFSKNPDFEGEAMLPGYDNIKLERIGNNYYISIEDPTIEQAAQSLSS